ncbi:MAG: SpoIIIAH-like family protein [Clostridia bacterium]|nr:SpoIIIAH-like family protein [Clostridia bacterium]
MTNTKKIALMSTLVLLLAVTAIFNFVLAGTGDADATGAAVEANYFTTYRSERSSTRSEEFVQLDSVLSVYEAESDEYKEAAAMKQKMVGIMEDELVLETMIKSLGFSDAVVSIGYDSDNVNVFINSSELTYDSALSIYSMLKNETGIASGNVIIMPVYAES